MTPKDKARELHINFKNNAGAIAAIMATDLIISILPKNELMIETNENIKNRELIFWEEVKNELEKL